MNQEIKKAVDFFKENKKYHRFLKGMAEKYKSRGTLGGTIELTNVTEDERNILCKIDTKYVYGKDAKVTVGKFLKIFENTWIGELDFQEILLAYFGGSIKTNREINEVRASNKVAYFNGIIEEFRGTVGEMWLKEAITSKKYGYILLAKEYESQPEELKGVLVEVIKAINFLHLTPQILVRLAIFASNLTKNPHFFDVNQLGGKLLVSGLAYLSKARAPENAEEESELLYRFGILKDEISNYTTVSSIVAYNEDGLHRGINGFYERFEPIQLNLWNLAKITDFDCTGGKIFVFENPAVFSEVLERTSNLRPTLLCTSGQLKLASIVLLDKLINKIDEIYYSGDFDPGGIKIAYRLKQRYGEKLVLWRYGVEEYVKIRSEVIFTDRRMNQISSIDDPQLKAIVQQMEKDRRCGYQELLVEKYIEDIELILKYKK